MILAASAVCFGKMTGVPFTVECRLGRLVEVRLLAMREPDVTVLQEAMRGAFVQVGRKVVICTDLRGIGLLSPTMADLMIGVLAKSNAHLERSAFLLLPEGALFHLQAERVVREAKSAVRRTFRDPRSLVAWLDDVLDDPERARVRAFLSVDE
jgi:hypothetical protein